MKHIELELEHKYKGEFVGRHRYRPVGAYIVLGSTRNANVRLLGDDVAGVHAVIEFVDNKWVISDMGGESGTWIKKKPIIEHEIQSICTVRIGAHEIKLVPQRRDVNIFVDECPKKLRGLDGQLFHQVIVRKADMVIDTRLLGPAESYHFSYGGEVTKMPAPTTERWQRTEFGNVVVQQRRIESKKLDFTSKDALNQHWDRSLRKPFLVAFLLLFVISGLVVFAPTEPDEELTQLKPEKNRYTRMVYDTKFARQKRKQALKVNKSIRNQAKRRVNKVASSSAAKQSTSKTIKKTKVANKIKNSGLSQLVGKISKRAAKTAKFVQRAGRSPDSANTGHAMASVGGISGLTKSTSGKSFKIKGVGTKGMTGSSSSLKGLAGLSAGNVGNSSVGIIEEETEIQGGLDKDIIARIIRSQLGQIRYCYERQLSARPDMYGKVLVKFTIGASGTVETQSVGKSTLNNAMVEGCMLRRIAGWKFPQPKGGTNVLVTYPFLFKSTN